MKKHIINIIFLFAFTSITLSQIDRSKQPKPGPEPEINLKDPKIFELKNGLKVFVVENNKLPRVNAYLTMDNPPTKLNNLIAAQDILGGMLGEGTNSMSKDDFNERIDFLGASLNFSADGAYMNSLSKYYPEVISMMADAIINPIFTEKEFSKEKQTLIDGIKSQEKDVETIARRVMRIAAYGKEHPYAESTSLNDAEKLTINDVKSYFNQHYKPNNAYLIIAGDVKFNDIKELVTKQFSDWKKGQDLKPNNPKPSTLTQPTITLVNASNAVQSNVGFTYPVDFKMNNKDYFAMILVNRIFGGGFNSRLNLNLREKHGYTYGARGGIGNDKYMTRFSTFAKVRNEVTDSTVMQSMKELKGLLESPITQKELDNAKATYKGSFVRDLEDARNQAFNTLNLYTESLPKDFYANYLESLNAVTLEDANRVAKQYFTPQKANMVVAGKANEILPNLKKLGYPIQYVDAWGNPTNEPTIEETTEAKPLPTIETSVATLKSPEQLINNYIKSIAGSKGKLADVRSLTTEGQISISAMPEPLSVSTYFVAPNRMAQVITTPMGVMKSVQDAEKVFQKMGPNKRDMPNSPENATKKGFFDQLYYLPNEMTYKGAEEADGKQLLVLEIKQNEQTTTEYYDAKTSYLIKQVKQTPTGEEVSTYSDYNNFDGIMLPTKIISSSAMGEANISISDAKINPEIDSSIFE